MKFNKLTKTKNDIISVFCKQMRWYLCVKWVANLPQSAVTAPTLEAVLVPVGLHCLRRHSSTILQSRQSGHPCVHCMFNTSVAAEWTVDTLVQTLLSVQRFLVILYRILITLDLRRRICKQVDIRLHSTDRSHRWTVSLSFVNGLKKETVAQQWWHWKGQ
jgi:hypothetical protein